MEILIFRTDIKSKKKVKSLQPIFNENANILDWSIDLEDIDNVLRIEATSSSIHDEVIKLVQTHGFYIKPLID